MKRLLFLGFLIMCLMPGRDVFAQTGTVFNDAGQQFAMYESARDNGTDPDRMYSHLLNAYNNYRRVAEASDNAQYLDATKRRLRQVYPLAMAAFSYYAEKDNPSKAFDFGVAYIEIPMMPVMQDSYLGRDTQYASILYYTAVAAYTQDKQTQATRYFNEYLNQPDADKEKDAYVYLSMIHQKEKTTVHRRRYLKKLS